MPHIKSSKRVAPLKDTDYDHEISLVDHEQEEAQQNTIDEMLSIPETTPLETPVDTPDAGSSEQIASQTIMTGNGATIIPAGTDSSDPVRTQSASQVSTKFEATSPSRQLHKIRSDGKQRRSIGSTLLSMGGTGAALGGGGILPVPSSGSSNQQYVMAVPNDSAALIVAASKTEVRGVTRVSVDEARGRSSSIGSRPKLLTTTVTSGVSTTSGGSANPLESTQSKTLDHEWVIDILYENQRGLFLCGSPFFSAKALGNLDPPPWTNAFHKPSLTDIHEAQVPDPSWRWVWPKWRVNHDSLIDCDDDGWEYSFMFSNKFRWHGPTWYSSFVRRRAWTRKRVKKQPGTPGLVVQAPTASVGMEFPGSRRESVDGQSQSRGQSSAVGSVADNTSHRGRSASQIHSRNASISRLSMASASRLAREELGLDDEGLNGLKIYDTTLLLKIIRNSRVDREKHEAFDNCLKNAVDDLEHLQDAIHKVMSLFVFQSSRRQVLLQIIQAAEDTKKKINETEADADHCSLRSHLQKRLHYLETARIHAEEEIRRLAFWSDVRTIGDAIGEPEAVANKHDDNGECEVAVMADISDNSDANETTGKKTD